MIHHRPSQKSLLAFWNSRSVLQSISRTNPEDHGRNPTCNPHPITAVVHEELKPETAIPTSEATAPNEAITKINIATNPTNS